MSEEPEIHIYKNEDGEGYTVAYGGMWLPGIYSSEKAARAVCGLDPNDILELWQSAQAIPVTPRQVAAFIMGKIAERLREIPRLEAPGAVEVPVNVEELEAMAEFLEAAKSCL